VRPGAVLTRRGLRIKTIRPRFSAVTQVSAVPANPLVRVSFNREGQVISARFIRSTGYADVDGPILASLYRWSAAGALLRTLDERITIQVRLILLPGPE